MGKNNRRTGGRTLAQLPLVSGVMPYLMAIVFFYAVCLCSTTTVKVTALVLLAAALLVGGIRAKALWQQVRWPLMALLAVVAMDFVSTLYAVSGKFALTEFVKVAAAFSLTLLLLALTPKKEETLGASVAAVLARATALMGLVSIDLLSTRWISGAVLSVLRRFSFDFIMLSGVEEGVRMISLFRNPNVFAGVAGIGVLLSLGLVHSCRPGKRRMEHLVFLFINALSFVLAFSMGATATIAVAFVVYLLLEQSTRRAGLLVLMLETLLVTIAAVIPISVTAFDAWNGVQPIPLLCVVFGSVVLCLLDRYVVGRLEERLAGRGKAALAAVAGLVAAVLVFAVVAYNLTGATELGAGESLRRSIYPQPGQYTLSAQTSAPVKVVIESQNREQTMMHTRTELYRGDLARAEFTVPEDCLVVYVTLSAGEDVRLEQVLWSGADDGGAVPLGYKLLPGFVANRIQGLFANQNAIQRTVFFEDGIKLFQRSPVVGRGMGSYENGVPSVQQFFYETKYAHNHYIQVLAETGAIGLLLFVGLLAVCAVVILRCRRQRPDTALTACLGGALAFMAGHAGVEVVFSYYAYLPFAFGVFALINLCCARPVGRKAVRGGVLAVAAAVLGVFLVLLANNVSAKRITEKSRVTFEELAQAAAKDRYEWADYMLTYVSAAHNAPDSPEVQAQAAEYAARLERVDSNTIPLYLAEYYFDSGNVERAMAMLEKYVTYVSSDPKVWQKAVDVMEANEVDAQPFRDGVARIVDLLRQWNEENMGQITLTPSNQAFLQRMGVQQ